MKQFLCSTLFLVLLAAAARAAPPRDPALTDHFEKKVRPLLSAHCWKCHGAEKSKSGLRLDSAQALARGGSSGPAIVPGKPEESRLIHAVQQTGELKMPPKGKLKDQEIADLVAWVKAGAVWPDGGVAKSKTSAGKFTAEQRNFWAFQPVRAAVPPNVKSVGWVKSRVDRFILAKLEAMRLWPALPADKLTLLRRVTFDLTGLPPTPREIDAFVADHSPDAFRKVVDRLLDSPHYGERWARHWLDVVRYAETTANDANAVMRYAWRYRDYVVGAFNKDKPYDLFVIEQLAGDLLPPTSDLSLAAERVIATGFLMVGPKALAETDKEQTRLDVIDDQLDVTGRAFLGLTFGCARCHDHKFDPIPTADYYALAGIFRGTEVFRDENRNASFWQERPLLQLSGEKPLVVMAPKEGKPTDLKVHLRGNRLTLGPLAPRHFPKILAGDHQPPLSAAHSGRLELARWIASKDNPLTARVMVNRIWQHHFGTGLVATSDNFGARGERPSYPELLDWLAARFIESGWSVKAMHRLILLSATYQQGSGQFPTDFVHGFHARINTAEEELIRANPFPQAVYAVRGELAVAAAVISNLKINSEIAGRLDPNNRMLWHMPRRRLDAESIRDAMLATSGRLDRTVGGGESGEFLFREGEVIDKNRDFFRPNQVKADHPYYTTSTRRSIYLPVVRNAVPDVLAVFDNADPNGVTAVRNDTTVPSQALYLLNHPFVREQALYFAKRLLDDAKATDAGRIDAGYRLALGRKPTSKELAETTHYLRSYQELARKKGRGETDARTAAWQSWCQTLLCGNEFLYVE
jgi:mono/diheme cytochrome c family protein